MYIPPSFAQTDRRTLLDFIRAHSFGLLVSQLGGEPFATHLPLLLDDTVEPHGELLGHMARANPHWKELAGQPLLVVFSGPHAYISPTWYEAERVVPTWNYQAVHVYGRGELVEDVDAAAGILTRYVETYERSLPSSWSIETGSEFFQQMLRGIVAFRIAITRIEGKWKLSQTQPAERRANAARHLLERDDADSRAIAALMNETLRG